MSKIEAIKKCIEIRYNEESEAWGFFPYVILEESRLGALTFNVLTFDVVEMVYEVARKRLSLVPREIHVILDFGPGGDMNNDFVAIISCEKRTHDSMSDFDEKKYDILAAPMQGYDISVIAREYNSKTGEILGEYKMSEKETLKQIAGDFFHAVV